MSPRPPESSGYTWGVIAQALVWGTLLFGAIVRWVTLAHHTLEFRYEGF